MVLSDDDFRQQTTAQKNDADDFRQGFDSFD
jgi:hypothetical protein